MTEIPTSVVVLDGFLAARAASVTEPTFAADREVIDWLRDWMRTHERDPIDDLTAYLLTHSTGRWPTDRELATVLEVVEAVPDFFAVWLPAVGATVSQLKHAATVVALLGRWLLVRRLIDDDLCAHLARFADLYEPRSLAPQPLAPESRNARPV